jgi:DNA polymerase III delta prime subunit
MAHDVHTVYPMMSVLLIGPSGTGKTTAAMRMAYPMVRSLPREEQPQLISGASTPEKLYEDLRANPHALLFASELANFFTKQKYMEGLIPAVTELLDYGETFERRTKGSGLVTVDKPSVTVIGCSTNDWLQEQLPDSATSGGFLARFLIVHEEHKAQSVPLPGRMFTGAQRARLEAARFEAAKEFEALVTQNIGEVKFESYEVDDIYSQWYQSHKPASGHLAPFAARAGEYILRLAMLLAVSCDRTVLRATDVASAIELYKWTERRLQDVVVPMSPQGKMLGKVLEAVGTDHMTQAAIRRAMRNHATSQDVDRYVDSLIQSGDLKRAADGKIQRS